MKKLLVILLLLLVFPQSVLAHTGLESSSPSTDETLQNPVTEITMKFNTELQPLSTFDVTVNGSDKVPIDKVTVSGATLKGILKEPLTKGTYTVNWKILGEDGHIVEKSYSFRVDAKIPETTTHGQPAPKETPAAAAAAPDAAQSKQAPQESVSPSGIAAVVGVLFLIILGAVLMKRRNS
ncbi:copper resistance CopC family protein [Paenibacillus sp. S-38]|uniref:copper resistance CopC family protein n=1 Tax=Paenibacillus sp. S-38 TaxID=3416710 RepID=UPI003CFAF366